MRKTYWIVGASCLALIALLIFQVKWMQYSRALVEEQFDQKVTMALCSVSENVARSLKGEESFEFLCQKDGGVACGEGILETSISEAEVRKVLDVTLERYAIDLDYRFQIVPLASDFGLPFPPNVAGYSCSIGDEKEMMKVQFLGRDEYVAQKLGWMTMASIILLVSVSVLFLFTLYQLLKQKRLNQWNIDFFNNMAHEFRTPLTNSQLALNLLQKKDQVQKDNKYVNIIRSENGRLLEQVERVLHIAKLEKGKLVLQSVPFSINDLLQEVMKDMSLKAQDRDGQLQLSQSDPNLMIKGDILHVGNAIRNVIDNAIKYCDQAPDIQLDLQKEGAYVKLSITDNGVGIDPKFKQTIFQQFFRITKGNQYSAKGFGLGLSYVKNVMEKHAGFLTVDSHPRQGSTFSLFFPVLNV